MNPKRRHSSPNWHFLAAGGKLHTECVRIRDSNLAGWGFLDSTSVYREAEVMGEVPFRYQTLDFVPICVLIYARGVN